MIKKISIIGVIFFLLSCNNKNKESQPKETVVQKTDSILTPQPTTKSEEKNLVIIDGDTVYNGKSSIDTAIIIKNKNNSVIIVGKGNSVDVSN